MKMTRQNETELVFQDSSYGFAAIFALCSLGVALVAFHISDRRLLTPAALLLLFSLAWLRRSTVVFDAASQTVRWTRVRPTRRSSDALPFTAISDVVLQTSSSPNGANLYRLALVARDARIIPFCDPYSGGSAIRYAAMREAALKILARSAQPASSSPAAPSAPEPDALDASIRALLQQGRTIEAIELARASGQVTLSAAKQRVYRIRQQIPSREIAASGLR